MFSIPHHRLQVRQCHEQELSRKGSPNSTNLKMLELIGKSRRVKVIAATILLLMSLPISQHSL